MPPINSIIPMIAKLPGLGEAATPLVREAASLVGGTQGGLAGFLDRFRQAGMGATVATWLGRTDGQALEPGQVEEVLGALPVTDIAGRTGLSREATGTALGQIIPKLVGALTPGGVVTAGLPAALTSFLAGGAGLSAMAGTAAHAAAAAPAGQDDRRGAGGWGVAMLAGLLSVGVIAWLMQPTQPPSAKVEVPAVPAPKVEAPVPPKVEAPVAPKVEAPAPTVPAKLDITNDGGTVTIAGAVHDEATRTSIMDMIRSAFGADKVKGDLSIDPTRTTPPWLANLRAALEAMKIPGLHALFDGGKLSLDGLASGADRERVMAALGGIFGSSLELSAHLKDKIADLLATATSSTKSALTALPASGFTAEALVKILNMSIINFDTGSAAIPESAAEILTTAAAKMKQLPAGTKLEIAGYTDNTGDPAANVTLSNQRAASVRDFLVQGGVDASILTAKGYGADKPTAPNDTPEGRFQNRRIEYHLIP